MNSQNQSANDEFYYKGYKFKLYPTDSQKEFINKCINNCRFIYNWALDKQIEHFENYKNGKFERKFYSTFELQKELTKLRNNPEYQWLKEVPNESLRSSIKRVNKAITMCSKTKNRFPIHKTKKNQTQSYQVRGDRFYFRNGKLRIEGLPNREFIEAKCPVNFDGRKMTLYNTVISLDALGNYWISFTVKEQKIKKPMHLINENIENRAIGIDLNVKDRFVCSNGYRSGSPETSHYEYLRSIYQESYRKDLKRKKEWEIANPEDTYVQSKRELKRELRYKKMNRKIANVEENFIQQETSKIIKMDPSVVVMEHLDNLEILSRHYVAKLTHKSSFYRCREVMQNKCNKYSIPFILADKTYPSSQLCSNCGNKHKIGTNKVYICPVCGLKIDRDLNAALNLKKLAQT